MTVDVVLRNFRRALRGLVPSLERVGIIWKRPDAYDEWDAIATTLFDNLVVSVLRWSLPSVEQEEFRLPSYDLLLASYEGFSTLEVTHPTLRESRWLFHAFGTKDEPFDLVEVREATEEGLPLGEDLEICPLEGTGFRLRLCQGVRTPRILEEVEMVRE